MARPYSTADVEDRTSRIATFEIDKIALSPALLKHYAALIEAVTKTGGHAKKNWSGIEIFVLKTEEELVTQLDSEKRAWDASLALYNRAVIADENAEPIREWERDSIKRFAEKEGMADPFDVFAANDPDLAKIREDLGLTV